MGQAKGSIAIWHRILFSLNIALFAVAWDASRENPRFIGTIASALHGSIPEPVARLLHISKLLPNPIFDFWSAWFILAMLVCIVVCLFEKMFQSRSFLCFAPPFVAAEAMPLFWFLLGSLTGRFGRGIYWWLAPELILVLGLIVLSFRREWRRNEPLHLGLFALHFGFWGWLTWSPSLWLWIIYPLLGFGSIIIWESYLALARGEHQSAA